MHHFNAVGRFAATCFRTGGSEIGIEIDPLAGCLFDRKANHSEAAVSARVSFELLAFDKLRPSEVFKISFVSIEYPSFPDIVAETALPIIAGL